MSQLPSYSLNWQHKDLPEYLNQNNNLLNLNIFCILLPSIESCGGISNIVGVVASKYIQLNPHWTDAKYLNMMNNLLCGVPLIFMRRIPKNTYLQLTHQIFYHIRACDPLQRRFFLAMMMRTQALGKSYSWSAREVSRLGLLLAEVSGTELSAINPEAMSGITARVMLEMPIHSLKSITELQLRYLDPKPLNILARKLIAYQRQQLEVSNLAARAIGFRVILLYISFVIIILDTK